MSKRSWIVVGGAVVSLLIACGVESVRATDYDQSCKINGDCVLVDQLEGKGEDCTIPCAKGAINQSAKDKYDKEYVEESGSCTSTKRAECTAAQAAICREGKCFAATLTDIGPGTIVDGGTD